MSNRTLLIIACAIVLLFVLVAGAIVWPEMRPRGFVAQTDNSAHGARVRAGNLADDPGPVRGGSSPKRTTGGNVITSSTPAERKRTPYDLTKLADGEVLVRAHVVLTSQGGLEALRRTARLPCDVCMRHVVSGAEPEDNYLSFEADGIIERGYPSDFFPIHDNTLSPAIWTARICWGEKDNFVAVAVPKLEGRVLDFGTLEFDLSTALGDQEWLVIGRLMHATGVPVHGMDSLWLEIGSPDNHCWFEQNEDGCFAFSHWGEFSTDTRVWLVISDFEDETRQPLTKTAIKGRIVDLGDIVVNCAAVEATIAAWPEKDLRRARRGLDANVEPPQLSAWLNLTTFSTSAEIHFMEPERTKVAFVMPGPYRWSAYQSDETLAFAETGGEIILEAGKLTHLDVAFVPVHSVLVRFKAAGELGNIQFEVQHIDADGESVEWENYQLPGSNQPHAVANPKRMKLKFTATTSGWTPVMCDVPPEATEWTIEFTERAPSSAGVLIVELPKMPEFFKTHPIEIGIFSGLVVDGVAQPRHLASYNQDSTFWGQTNEADLLRWEVPLGATKVWLQEVSQVYGYPRGIISGPVDCTVSGETPCKVKLPEFGAPPWNVFAQSAVVRLTCDGVPMNYYGPVMQGETSQVMSLYYDSQQRMSVGDYAIPDGAQRHALQMTMPTEQAPRLLFERDFPARIEVRVRRGKTLVPCLIEVTVASSEGSTSTEATSRENGKLRLWAPIGEVRVSVQLLGGQTTLSRAITLGNDLTVMELAVEGSYARFSWHEQYSQGEGSYWWLRDAQGEMVTTLNASMTSLKLEPGAYVMVPENASKPEIAFAIAADSDAVVEVPFVPRLDYSGSFLVKYPKELKPDPDGYALEWYWYVPVSGDPAKDILSREYASEYGWARCTAEGVKFGDMPANLEFVLMLAIGALNDEGDHAPQAWAISPMRVKLKGGELETLAVDWKRAAVLHQDWYEQYTIHWSGPNGDATRYTQYNRILLPGTYVAIIEIGDAPKSINVAVKLDDGKYFEVPEDVKKALNADESTEEEGGD